MILYSSQCTSPKHTPRIVTQPMPCAQDLATCCLFTGQAGISTSSKRKKCALISVVIELLLVLLSLMMNVWKRLIHSSTLCCVNKKLSFTEHDTAVQKKSEQRLHILRKLQAFNVDPVVLLRLYRNIIEHPITYCNICYYPALSVSN